jgi:hypothetical protein
MTVRPIVLMSGLLLYGCASEPPVERFRLECESYGFRPETDSLAACILQKSQADEGRDFARSQRATQEGMDMMMGTGVWAVE